MLYPIEYTPEKLDEYQASKLTIWEHISASFKQLPFAIIVIPLVFLIIAIVLIIYSVGWFIFRLFLHEKDEKDQQNSDTADAQGQEQNNPDLFRVEMEYEEKTGWLKLKFNHIAFKEFVAALANVFFEKKAPMIIDYRGLRRLGKDGFHVHTGDIFPALECDIILGISDGLFEIDSDKFISASQEVWHKAIVEWRQVLLRKEPVMIILDKYQQEWCMPDSKGRISIEYIPDTNTVKTHPTRRSA